MRSPWTGAPSNAEAEVQDIAIPHFVLLAFEPQLTLVLGRRHRTQADEVIVMDRLGADEATLDVAVDLAGGDPGGRACVHRPGTHLVLADGEEADEIEEIVGAADEDIARRV